MDIQGSEPYLFLGAPKLVDATDLLLTEFWPYGLSRLGYDAEDFLKMIGRSFKVGAFVDRAIQPSSGLMPFDQLIECIRERSRDCGTQHFDLVLCKEPRF